METYADSTYGDRIADVYDQWFEPGFDYTGPVETTVEFLRELAGKGPALELGIGTGRVALPLARLGVRVQGIDVSEAMVAKLREKEAGSDIPVTIGSFADFELPERFGLVYVPFNTFFGLRTQEEQVSCFAAVARHLTDAGVFVIEAFVPDITRFQRGSHVSAMEMNADELRVDVSLLEPSTQQVHSRHLIIRDGAPVRVYPVELRFSYPSELDLMARLAGLRLRERWGNWDRTPFTGEGKHISVWEPAR
jgi:SAM-dependent methyltransferase